MSVAALQPLMATDSSLRRLDLGPPAKHPVFVPQKDVGEEAVVVWDAALVLAFFIQKHYADFINKATVVLELGAGTGAVGLCCAALGAKKVILSDLPRILPLLQEGIDLNKGHFKGQIEARALSWGQEQDLQQLEDVPDLILVSDCIYYEASVKPLISTLNGLCRRNRNCVILLSYETRDYLESKKVIAKEFFRAVSEHFQICPFGTQACHEDYACDDIRVIKLLPK